MPGKKILVVDDSLTIQKVIRLALSNEGYEIQATSDGGDASQQIALFRPDIVLVDVSLPGKSAFELKAESNAEKDAHKPKFVLMSSAFEQVDEERAAQVGFDARLVKPFDPGHLRQILSDVVATVPPQAVRDEPLPPPAGFSDELWENPPTSSLSRSAPMEGVSIRSDADSESDIKKLTESTMKMSGMDDFQWSVNESSKKAKAPFDMDSPEEPILPAHGSYSDVGDSNFSLKEPTRIGSGTLTNVGKEEAYRGLPLTPPPAASSLNAQVVPVSTAEIEDAVKRQVAETLEKMAQRILPDLAEKIIKQEINRMLNEQP